MGLFKKLFNDVTENMKEALEQTKNEFQASINDKRNEIEQSLSSRLNGLTSKVDSPQRSVEKPHVENNSIDSREEKNEIIETEYGTIKNGVLVINEGIKVIKEHSLSEYKTIKKVVFPASLTNLQYTVIDNLPQLEELDFSKVNKLKFIPPYFIKGENKISHFSIPEGVEEVGCYCLGKKDSKPMVIEVSSTVQKFQAIISRETHSIEFWVFGSELDLDYIAKNAKTFIVLEKDAEKYKKQLAHYGHDVPVGIIKGFSPDTLSNQEETDTTDSCEKAAHDAEESNPEEKNNLDNNMTKNNIEKEPSSIEDDSIIFSPRLEALIKSAFKDGILTQKEKDAILRRVEKDGEDLDEFEMLFNERIEKKGINVIEENSEESPQKLELATSDTNTPPTPPKEKGRFSEKLLFLIDNALEDGVLTDQEKNAIIKRAQAEGEDIDEVDIYIQSLQHKRQKELQEQAQESAAKEMEARRKAQEAKAKADQEEEKERATILRECPACGSQIPHLSNVCPECGHVISTSEKDKEIMELIKAFLKSKENLEEIPKEVYKNDTVMKKAYSVIEDGNGVYYVKSNYQSLKTTLELLYIDNPKVNKLLKEDAKSTKEQDKEITELIQALAKAKKGDSWINKKTYDNDPILKRAYRIKRNEKREDKYYCESNYDSILSTLKTLYIDNPKVKKALEDNRVKVYKELISSICYYIEDAKEYNKKGDEKQFNYYVERAKEKMIEICQYKDIQGWTETYNRLQAEIDNLNYDKKTAVKSKIKGLFKF